MNQNNIGEDINKTKLENDNKWQKFKNRFLELKFGKIALLSLFLFIFWYIIIYFNAINDIFPRNDLMEFLIANILFIAFCVNIFLWLVKFFIMKRKELNIVIIRIGKNIISIERKLALFLLLSLVFLIRAIFVILELGTYRFYGYLTEYFIFFFIPFLFTYGALCLEEKRQKSLAQNNNSKALVRTTMFFFLSLFMLIFLIHDLGFLFLSDNDYGAGLGTAYGWFSILLALFSAWVFLLYFVFLLLTVIVRWVNK